ncbi:MAG: BAX inhibitor (BI)-1/YccA family protein [Bacteroidetes bacterium]|nr:MAG: BAX inhibitor (BI)-1/YccA family protein [Bacteroidota bacterium]
MNFINQQEQSHAQAHSAQGDMVKNFIANVFSWMGIAMAITAITAYFFANDEELIGLLISSTGGMSTMGWVVMLAPLGLVIWMNRGFQKLSYGTLVIIFGAFAILMGMSLSFILLIYTASSIFQTFLTTSIMFAVMAVVGYTTKTDLTKFGSILFMALIGLIIASVINMFLGSAMMDYIISFVGVLIFTGLIAYDVQKLKKIGGGLTYQNQDANKLAIMGALSLYLDFINLFLFLLRFMGNRK